MQLSGFLVAAVLAFTVTAAPAPTVPQSAASKRGEADKAPPDGDYNYYVIGVKRDEDTVERDGFYNYYAPVKRDEDTGERDGFHNYYAPVKPRDLDDKARHPWNLQWLNADRRYQ